jgi:hypothetical protein
VVNATIRPLYPRGKTRYPRYRRLGGSQGRSGRVCTILLPPVFDLIRFLLTYALFCVLFANWHSPATLTEVFPRFFLSCKANARVYLAKTGHGPHSSQFVACVVLCIVCVDCVVLFIVCIDCVVLCIVCIDLLFYVLFVSIL